MTVRGTTHEVSIYRLDGLHHSVLLPDHLSDDLGLRNLLLIRSGLLECLAESFCCEFTHGRANIERFNSFGPEGLITEEGFDDGWLRAMSIICLVRLTSYLTIPALKLAPEVPAPP